ncbi:MAG: ATP-binding protein [Ignavibacteriaceae bacterium]|nr:ATP-binding protein [Ignavibacteriaceae bacterium]
MENIKEELYNFNPWWEADYKPALIRREKYLQKLNASLKQRDIIILTGLRRIGKTSIMKQFISDLCNTENPKTIFYASLDSILLEKFSVHYLVREFRKIHHLKRDQKIFLFFDEAAYREDINRELKNLYDSENVKLFVSSSSSSILRDKSALLTGRTKRIEILPLDFSEYLNFKNLKIQESEQYLTEQYFEDYMRMGGIPEFILTSDTAYLENLIESIIYKDIAFYRGVSDTTTLKEFFRVLMERAGKQLSLNKVSNIMGISTQTAKRYFDYFRETYLIYTMERYGKLNERIRAPKKIYAADTGIRNYITGFRDKGSLFENLFYLLIKDKSPSYIYKDGTELDFYYDDIICEIKYGLGSDPKQQALMDSMKAKKKYFISGVDSFLDFEKELYLKKK